MTTMQFFPYKYAHAQAKKDADTAWIWATCYLLDLEDGKMKRL